MPTEPQTEAGRALVRPVPSAPPHNRMAYHHPTCDLWANREPCSCGLALEVAAIEAEARAAALSEAAERVEGLDVRYDGEGDKPPDVSVDRAAVLGLLDPS